MDLRRRLIGSLSLLLASLMGVATLIQFYSLRADIASEVGASARLVSILLAAENGALTSPSDMAQRLAAAGIRHLSIRTPDQAWPEAQPHPVLAWLSARTHSELEQEIRVGGQTLFIAANPHSEIDERLGDSARILITLLLFSGATLLVVWWSADRALRPVRALEEGLHRLAQGEAQPGLPEFALREFRRVAGAIDFLAQALAEARAGQRALARQLITVQEDERKALARELHDEMGQTLTALHATAAHLARHAPQLSPEAVAECAGDLRRDIRTSGEQLRAMLKSLRPHGLDATGLAQTLRELVEGWRSRATGVNFELELPVPFPELAEREALSLYRVAQEALTNVVRHSAATHCHLSVQHSAQGTVLTVQDDGLGVDMAHLKRGCGLLGMVERLEMVGGRLDWHSGPCQGVRVCAWLPQRAEEGRDD